MVLMGVRPTYPSTKYGYIVPAAEQTSALMRVARFAEKPNVEKAIELLDRGAFWNGGVFGGISGGAMRKQLSLYRSDTPVLNKNIARIIIRGKSALKIFDRSGSGRLPSYIRNCHGKIGRVYIRHRNYNVSHPHSPPQLTITEATNVSAYIAISTPADSDVSIIVFVCVPLVFSTTDVTVVVGAIFTIAP